MYPVIKTQDKPTSHEEDIIYGRPSVIFPYVPETGHKIGVRRRGLRNRDYKGKNEEGPGTGSEKVVGT